MAAPTRVPPRTAVPHRLQVRFWGVRGSTAVPGPNTLHYGGNTACVEVRHGREIVILDAGTGIRELGKQLEEEFNGTSRRITILITHTHWDHIQGFPFFAPAYNPKHQIRILGWRGSRAGLNRTVTAAVESPYFPVALREMPSSISVKELRSSAFRIGALRGSSARLHHPGGGVAIRLAIPGATFAYVTDHEVAFDTGDGRDPRMRALIEGVDVLVHDAQYTADEYPTRRGWGHSSVESAVRVAAEARVRRLILFHHDPDRDDQQMDRLLSDARSLARALGVDLVVDAAREGQSLEIG